MVTIWWEYRIPEFLVEFEFVLLPLILGGGLDLALFPLALSSPSPSSYCTIEYISPCR